MIFFPRRLFDARTDVDAPGPDTLDGGQHVARVQPTRNHYLYRQPGRDCPIECQSGTAVRPARWTIKENRFRRGTFSSARHRRRSRRRMAFEPDAQVARGSRRAVRRREVGSTSSFSCATMRRITAGSSLTKTPTFQICGGRSASQSSVSRIGVACALAIKVEAQSGGAELDRGLGVLAIGDAADLHEHKRRTASAGSPDFMRCSPTRNAE